MIPAAFDYVRASSLEEAIYFLHKDPDGTKLLAGGHTLIPTLKLRLATPARLVDIGGIAELQGIQITDRVIRIGALTRHAELLASNELREVAPIFSRAANRIADPQVRNRGTIGGSLANADPAADWPAVVIALKAELELVGNGIRHVAARDFFVDIFTTALEPTEMLTAIIVPRPVSGMRFAYRKIRHPASGYAILGVAVGIHLKDGLVADASIGLTGVANHAFEGRVATDTLIGKPLTTANVEEAARLLSENTECLSDHYASAAYRASLIKTETRRALLEFGS
ncbi:FAD binding domain-containing protein [Bradyrhizobium australafricanum]|uniref:FAD binding domain-containing protein n=1 Tax=Bradyrhizobium australafricanum TaxID=2821406 RepID=UPI001CE25A05|nr:xanthine dehydrogenase family protein subunit M [Bradyrhizobium australafricanum]MCA6100510.1 xanthine dehydrogenase family protein subunit M [Bradyrhizobium australafricanum]